MTAGKEFKRESVPFPAVPAAQVTRIILPDLIRRMGVAA